MPALDAQIRALFDATREDPGATFEEENFLQQLVRPTAKPIDDSFKGKRFKNRFIDRLQLELRICLPDDALEKKWRFEDFVAYVEERRRKPAVNLRMAQKRLQGSKASDITLLLVLNLLLLPPLGVIGAPWLYLYLVLPLALNALVIGAKIKSIRYYRRLIRALETPLSQSHPGI
ncbi:MAG: hypothetical protein QNJ67_06420 [Kiloniellales bacterium]|nr:hypothetical protein [Kiloniellales bacterium]